MCKTIGSNPAPQKNKIKTETLYDPIYEISIWKRHLHPYVYCSVIYNSQGPESILVPTNGRMDKCM
jgi:hypothetical protein